MPVGDIWDFLQDDALTVPVPLPDGSRKDYRIPSPDHHDGLWMATLANLGIKAHNDAEITERDVSNLELDDDAERDLYRIALGTAYSELIADHVSWERIRRVGKYAFMVWAFSKEQADEAVRKGALSGEAPRPNRAQKRAAATRPASTASANKTPRRASTASSATPARKRAKAARG
jgi:hypothetical protein